jgi:hypothetical protein
LIQYAQIIDQQEESIFILMLNNVILFSVGNYTSFFLRFSRPGQPSTLFERLGAQVVVGPLSDESVIQRALQVSKLLLLFVVVVVVVVVVALFSF